MQSSDSTGPYSQSQTPPPPPPPLHPDACLPPVTSASTLPYAMSSLTPQVPPPPGPPDGNGAHMMPTFVMHDAPKYGSVSQVKTELDVDQPPNGPHLKVAQVGCLHGSFDLMYERLSQWETVSGQQADVIVCPGDLQAARDEDDLASLVLPCGRQPPRNFTDYFQGTKVATRLTLMVGGNHECSQYLQALSWGGWIAPNMFFLGRSGIVRYRGLRFGGFSGIFKEYNAEVGFWERAPYCEEGRRSVYHHRYWEMRRFCSGKTAAVDSSLDSSLDVMISHDWPRLVTGGGQWASDCRLPAGHVEGLTRRKPDFAQEIAERRFSSPILDLAMIYHRPRLWLAGHFHVHYETEVSLPASRSPTRFCSLDKPNNKDDFLKVHYVELNTDTKKETSLEDEGQVKMEVEGPITIELDMECIVVAGILELSGIPKTKDRVAGPLWPMGEVITDMVSLRKELINNRADLLGEGPACLRITDEGIIETVSPDSWSREDIEPWNAALGRIRHFAARVVVQQRTESITTSCKEERPFDAFY